MMAHFPQRKDSGRTPRKIAWRLQNQAADFSECGKVLNLCRDSKCHGAVIFRALAQNKFINCLRLSEAGRIFPTTGRRYADK
jgi:hypothetical protein